MCKVVGGVNVNWVNEHVQSLPGQIRAVIRIYDLLFTQREAIPALIVNV